MKKLLPFLVMFCAIGVNVYSARTVFPKDADITSETIDKGQHSIDSLDSGHNQLQKIQKSSPRKHKHACQVYTLNGRCMKKLRDGSSYCTDHQYYEIYGVSSVNVLHLSSTEKKDEGPVEIGAEDNLFYPEIK